MDASVGRWSCRLPVLILVLCCLAMSMRASAQDFFDLSAEDVMVGTRLPFFEYAYQLGTDYEDSIYTVEIEYPEFIEMGEAETERYLKLANCYAQDDENYPEVAVVPGALPSISTHISVGRKKGMLMVSFVPIVYRDGGYKKLVSFKLKVKSSELTPMRLSKRSERSEVSEAASDGRYADNSVLQSGTWVKIRVPETGIYQLTETLIKKAGFSDLSKVKIYGYGGNLQPETLTESYLTTTDDLTELATCTIDGKRLFYGYGPVYWEGSVGGGTNNLRVRNPYSDYGYYFLTENDDEPLSVDSAAFIDSFYPSYYYNNTLYEVDDYAWFSGGRNLYDQNLFGNGTSRSYTLDSYSKDGTGRVTVVLTGSSAMTATVAVNDSVVGTISITSSGEYDYAQTSTGSYEVDNLEEENTITITQNSSGNMRLDYISIYSDDAADVPDLHGTFDAPEYVYGITNQNLHSHTPVDMTIIVPTTQEQVDQAERLASLHEQYDGMTTRIVPADEIFNEFSSGTPDATAYKRYMKMLYDRATDDNMPKYLVLFGDGAWDNRMLTTSWSGYSPDDYLLCFESENSLNKVDCFVTDDFFCLLDDDESLVTSSSRYAGQPDIAVGRFPARTTTQATAMVDKVEKYLANDNAGIWQNTIIFMGDDGNDNAHMNDAALAAAIVEENYPAFDVRKVMWDAYEMETTSTGNSYPDVRSLLQGYMESGALIMNYSGHGSETLISHEAVLDISDFEDIETDALPLWITASCDIMPFDGQTDNIGEEAMINPNGGAVAFYGTTRTVYQSYNSMMNQEVMSLLLATQDGERLSIGEAIRQAKVALVSSGSSNQDYTANKLQYNLLGDPALVLSSPTMTAVIDSINSQVPSEDDLMTLNVGNTVKVDGHIAASTSSADGITTDVAGVATDFSGVLTALVKGAEEEIVCRLNNTTSDGADTAFVYYDRNSTIFSGSDSVRSGSFSFSFVVPKDIDYDDGAGQILVYAINNDKTKSAHGADESIAFNGTGELPTDSIGPSVFCYLNSSSFVDGGKVNATPYFVAEITDQSGINATGSGIGHDMQLVIDGDASTTYTLNDYFEFDFGSYTSGTLGYSIPELEEGDHQLQFRVWDILNNSTTSQLSFTVAYGLAPRILSVEATKNPATSSTVFRIVHDRMGSDVYGVIEIFDMAGRKLWYTSFEDDSSSSATEVSWDLTVSGGRPLSTGVYLYRVRMACDGSSYVSKTKKLIIISNK